MHSHGIKLPLGMRATDATSQRKVGEGSGKIDATQHNAPSTNGPKRSSNGASSITGKHVRSVAHPSAQRRSSEAKPTTVRRQPQALAPQQPEATDAHGSRAVLALELLEASNGAPSVLRSGPWQDWELLRQADEAVEQYKVAKARGTGRVEEGHTHGASAAGSSAPELVYVYPSRGSAGTSRSKSASASLPSASLTIDIDGGVRFTPLRGVVYAPSDSLHSGYGTGPGMTASARKRRASLDSTAMLQLYREAGSSASAVGPAHGSSSNAAVSRFGDLASPKRVTEKPMAAGGHRPAQATAPASPTAAGGVLEGRALELPGAGPPNQRLSVHHVQGLGLTVLPPGRGEHAGMSSAEALAGVSACLAVARAPVLVAPHAVAHAGAAAAPVEVACAVDARILLLKPRPAPVPSSTGQELSHSNDRERERPASSPLHDQQPSASPGHTPHQPRLDESDTHRAVYTGHTQRVTALASHPYLPILASAQIPSQGGSKDSSAVEGDAPIVHLWHAHTLSMLCAPLAVPASSGVLVQDCAFSPCGQYLSVLVCDVQPSQQQGNASASQYALRHSLCTWDLYALDAPAAPSSPAKGLARAPVASTVGFGGPLIGAYLRGEIGPRLLPGSPSDVSSIASPQRSIAGQLSPPLSSARSPIPSSSSGVSDIGAGERVSLGSPGVGAVPAPLQVNLPVSVLDLSVALTLGANERVLGLRAIQPLGGQASLLPSTTIVSDSLDVAASSTLQKQVCAIMTSKQVFHSVATSIDAELSIQLAPVHLGSLAHGQGAVLDASSAQVQLNTTQRGAVTVVAVDGLHPAQPLAACSSHSVLLPQGNGCTVGVYLDGVMVTVVTLEHDAAFSGLSCLSQAFLPPGAHSRCQASALFAVCFLDGVVSLLECVVPPQLQGKEEEQLSDRVEDVPALSIRVVGTLNVPCADGQSVGLSMGGIYRAGRVGVGGRNALTLHLAAFSSEGLLHCTSQSLEEASDGLVQGAVSLFEPSHDLRQFSSHEGGEEEGVDMVHSLVRNDNDEVTDQDKETPAGPLTLSMHTEILQHSAGAGLGSFSALAVHPYFPLYAVGTTNGRIDLYDSRTKQRLSTTDSAFDAATVLGPRYTGMGVSGLDFCPDGFLLAISMSTAHAHADAGPVATGVIGHVFIVQLKLPMQFLQALMGIEAAPRASPLPPVHSAVDTEGLESRGRQEDAEDRSVDGDGSVGSHRGMPSAAAAKPLSPDGIPIQTNNPLLMAAGSVGGVDPVRGPSPPILGNAMSGQTGPGARHTPDFEVHAAQGLGLGMSDLVQPASSPGAYSVKQHNSERTRDVARYISAALRYSKIEDILQPHAVDRGQSASEQVSMLELYAHTGLDKSYSAVPTCIRWAPLGTTPGGTPVVHAPFTAAGSAQRGRTGLQTAKASSASRRQGTVSPSAVSSVTTGALHDVFVPVNGYEQPLPGTLHDTLSTFLPGVQAHLGVVQARGRHGAAVGSAGTSTGAPTLAVGTDACTIEVFVLNSEGSSKPGSAPSAYPYAPGTLRALLKRKKTLRHVNSDARLAVPVLGMETAQRVLGSRILSLDWEETGRFLQAGTDAWEIHTWEADGGTKVRHAAAIRDVTWATQSCALAWHLAGAWASNAAALSRSNMIQCSATAAGCDITVTGHADGTIRVYRYPALSPFALPTVYAGHGREEVRGVAFLARDEGLVTYSGHSIVVWAVEDLGAFTPAVAPVKKHSTGTVEPIGSMLQRHVQRAQAARARLLQPPRPCTTRTAPSPVLQRGWSASASDGRAAAASGVEEGDASHRPGLLTSFDATLMQNVTGIGALSLDEPQELTALDPLAQAEPEGTNASKVAVRGTVGSNKGRGTEVDVPFEFVNIASPTTPTSRQMKEFTDKLDAQREAMHREAAEEKRAEDRARQLAAFAHPARIQPIARSGHAPGETQSQGAGGKGGVSAATGGKQKGGKGKKR